MSTGRNRSAGGRVAATMLSANEMARVDRVANRLGVTRSHLLRVALLDRVHLLERADQGAA